MTGKQNPRAYRTNPRALGTSPRALGTNEARDRSQQVGAAKVKTQAGEIALASYERKPAARRMTMSKSVPSGIKALAEDLRLRGELPPPKRELRKELRERGELPPTPKQLLKKLAAQNEPPASNVRTKKADEPVEKADEPVTTAEYNGLQAAFDFLNAKLFAGALKNVVILLQRRAHSGGHFSPDRFTRRVGGGEHHEISLNPDGFVTKSDEWIISVLLHEMVHEWQHLFGQKKRASYGYHDKEWAAKMESLGLQPSNSGMVGGKRTGQQMQHYIIPHGPYAQAFAELAASGWKLKLESTIYPGGEKKKDESHTKFVCPACGWIVRGKPDTVVIHEPCGRRMLAERPASQFQSYDQAAE
jgi:SprT-like family